MKVALFGGRFDPPHFGHLLVGRELFEEFGFDKVKYLVNFDPPHKKACASFVHRVRMLNLLLKGEEGLEVETFEGDMGISPSYTVDVLTRYREVFSEKIFFVLGSDQLLKIHTWKEYKILPSLAKIVVITRGKDSIPTELFKELEFEVLRVRTFEVSSSEIRKRIREGKSIRGLTAQEVVDYIDFHGLYSQVRNVEVFIDGSARENPGRIRIGFVVLIDGKRHYELSKEMGFGTNNEAEYLALENALIWLKENSLKNAKIYSDSELLVKQISGEYRLNAQNLKQIYQRCLELLEETSAQISYIPRERNLADRLTKIL